MSWMLWLLIVSRIAICVGSGEIAIRYFAWWLMLRGKKPPIEASWVILGLSLLCLTRFFIEFQWVTALIEEDVYVKITSLVENDVLAAVARLAQIVALGFLTYPVAKIQYNHSWEKALVEMVVRAFLIVVSAVAGYMIAMVRIHYMGH